MKQTAIVIDVGRGREVLVRIAGVHVHSSLVLVDERENRGTWTPTPFYEVRHEGER